MIYVFLSVLNRFSFFGPGSGQYMPNTRVTCHHKFQSDRCIWEPTLHCIAFPLSLINVTFTRLCFLQFLHSISPHDPILTKHQALAPSSPILLSTKISVVRVEFSLRPSARAWQETHDLRNTMKHTAHIIPQTCEKSPHSSSHL